MQNLSLERLMVPGTSNQIPTFTSDDRLVLMESIAWA